MIRYSISKADKAVAGRTPYIIVPRKNEVRRQFNYENVKVYDTDEEHTSIIANTLGLPVFMSLQFSRNLQYIEGVNGNRPEDLIIPCCIVEVNIPKIVKRTEVQGYDKHKAIKGTVMESNNMGDAIVSIKGILSDESGNYPAKLVQQFWQYMKAPVAFDVTHELLTMLEVYALVIENVNFPSPNGKQNIQPFELQCVGDDPQWQEELIKDKLPAKN